MRRTVNTRDSNWREHRVVRWIHLDQLLEGRPLAAPVPTALEATPPVDENVPKSRNASSTSPKRLNAQNRRSGFQ
jgi:hypothetical protein